MPRHRRPYTKKEDWKRSVIDSKDWPGWDGFIKQHYDQIPYTKYPEDSKACFLTVFQGGFRSAEAIHVKRDMVKWNDEVIVIGKVNVLKKKDRTLRDVLIKRDKLNPLADDFIDLVENGSGDYLIPKRLKFSRGLVPDKPTTTRTVYNRINEISGRFPHELRAYRAMMLVAERDFTVSQLMRWFEWSKADMAIHYTATRDLAASMGITKLPTLEDMKK